MKKLFIILIIIIIITGCSNSINTKGLMESVNITTPQALEFVDSIDSDNRIPITSRKKEVTISAVGDIMVHKQQLIRGYNSESDTFDFFHAFQYIEPYLKDSDLTIGNLETTLAGKDQGIKFKEGNHYQGYSGYPCFNTPEILAENLKDVGFDLLSTANNHSLDSRPKGVISTLDVLDSIGLSHVGTYRSQEEKDEFLIKEINDIAFGFSAYTYGTNGFPVPEDKPYLVNTLDMYNSKYIDNMVEEIKELDKKVDIVVVSIHFGNEYFDFPNNHQRDIVDKLFKAGADVILGSHPHVIQPIEIRRIEENEEERLGVVIYSLGNFISSQRYTANRPKNTDIGVIFNIHFTKIHNNSPIINAISFVPTYNFRTDNQLSVIPVDETYDNLESENIDLDNQEINRLTYSYNNTYKHILSYLTDDYDYEYNDYSYIIQLEDSNY
ncbi:MAG: CapA family protein [Eubacteriales bacterium]